MWLLRLDHIGKDRISKQEKDGILDSLNSELYLVCESCLQRIMIKLSFIGYGERTTEILALVHTDVCGPLDMQAKGDYLYFIIFINDYSWYGYVYLMRYKFEAFEKFKEFRYEVKK